MARASRAAHKAPLQLNRFVPEMEFVPNAFAYSSLSDQPATSPPLV